MSSKPKCLTEKQRLKRHQEIILLLEQSVLNVSQIAKMLKCDRGVVYKVMRELKAKLAEPKPVTRETLEPGAVIAGENFLQTDLPKELVKSECVNCLRPMWTRNPKFEDLCEECNYQLMLEAAQAQTVRDVPKISHAFDEADNIGGGGFDFPGDINKLF